MRKLQTSDVFAMSRILTKLDINDYIRKLSESKIDSSDEGKAKLGVDFIMTILSKATTREIEKEIYAFLASILECSAKEIAESDPIELIDKLKEAGSAESWTNFFTYVVRLIRGES